MHKQLPQKASGGSPVADTLIIRLVALTNDNQISTRAVDGTTRNHPNLALLGGRSSVICQGTPITKPNSRSFDVFVLKYLIAFPPFFLVLYGTLPVAISAMYGGNPPPHIASLLDKQMDTFSTVSKMIFGPITPSTPAAASDKVAPKEPP